MPREARETAADLIRRVLALCQAEPDRDLLEMLLDDVLDCLADDLADQLPDLVRCQSMSGPSYALHPIGRVESALVDPASAPKQGNEGAPDAWLEFDPAVLEGLRDLRVGSEIILLTWLDRARRDVLVVHPRDDPANPETGVFSTRSADRPNPVGLHRVEILAIAGTRLRVRNLEALDGTPVIDVKPVLESGER